MNETIRKPLPAEGGLHKFTIATKQMQDYGVETPVSGATGLVTARDAQGRLEVFSIGSDGYLYQFRRDPYVGVGWRLRRLPWEAKALTVVRQRDHSDRVFFTDMDGGKKCRTTLYELVPSSEGHILRRRRGRLATTDPRVYGVTGLTGVQCRDGSNAVVTALAAHPPGSASNWVLLFRDGRGVGALSTTGTQGVVATRVAVLAVEPGSARWPELGLALIYDGRVCIEWGVQSGPLLQTEPIEVPEIEGAVEIDVASDHAGRLRLFVLDAAGRLHVLAQTGSVEGRPIWASAWQTLDTSTAEAERTYLRQLKSHRTAEGDLIVLATDHDDNLFAITESGKGWGLIKDLETKAAHFDVGVDEKGHLEVFAVSRHDHFVRLARSEKGRFDRQVIEWDAASGECRILNVYRTGLSILNEDDGMVAGVKVYITANRQLSAVVNGLSYSLNPSEPVVALTNAFGKVNVIFEVQGKQSVPSLSFEADFLDGVLNVCPQRNVQLYMESITREELLSCAAAQKRMHLIPENTVIQQV